MSSDQYRKLAADCLERARYARKSEDVDAWLLVAEDWLRLARHDRRHKASCHLFVFHRGTPGLAPPSPAGLFLCAAEFDAIEPRRHLPALR
jgi:hypothetical protein